MSQFKKKTRGLFLTSLVSIFTLLSSQISLASTRSVPQPVSCGAAVFATILTYSSFKSSKKLDQRTANLKKYFSRSLSRNRVTRLFKIMDKAELSSIGEASLGTLGLVATAINGLACVISPAMAAEIVTDPILALEENTQFQQLAEVVGFDQALIAMERVAQGEKFEEVLQSLVSETVETENHSTEGGHHLSSVGKNTDTLPQEAVIEYYQEVDTGYPESMQGAK